jgi:hypothetical protein
LGILALVGLVLLRPAAVAHRQAYAEYSVRTEKETGWAPVQLWWESSPDDKERWRAKNAVRLTLTRGEAFHGNTHIPREHLREFLDARVLSGEIDCVVVFPAKGTKWGEIFPVLDECRKSSVQIVLLSEHES